MPRRRRNTQEELIMLKQYILDECIKRAMVCKEGAIALKMHPKALSRLKRRYLNDGVATLVPKKPGPRVGRARVHNRTPYQIEDVVVTYAVRYPFLGPIPLMDKMREEQGIVLDSVTVSRILKRKKIRYTREYKRWKADPKLYCLEKPGKEVQMDGCYPYGRARDIVQFDAIDDCSRHVYGYLYEKEDADSAIDFVKRLVQEVPYRIERIRVDNRYGTRLREYCKGVGIKIIENTPYRPEENGKIERFHKTVKRELYWRICSYQDPIPVLQYKLWQYLGYYNTKRRHGGYGMNRMTPNQKIATTLLESLPQSYPHKVTSSLQQYKH